MRRLVALFGALSAVAAAFSLTTVSSSAKPVQPATFVIPSSDGYGVADCIASGGACGQVVADGWCEANGYGRATHFGPLAKDEVTGSISNTPDAGRAALAITCGE